MTLSPNTLIDGFQTLSGVNGGVAPNTLPRHQVSSAVNMTFRNGFAKTRPGWRRLGLKFTDQNGQVDTTLRDNFEDGLFQGAAPFERLNQLVVSVSGRLFAIDLTNLRVFDVSVPGDVNSPILRKAWMIEAEDWMIVQDGQSLPIFYTGSGSRRSLGSAGSPVELPVGTVMSYNSGRVWVANPARRAFIAGDLVYGPTNGTSEFNNRDTILQVTENTFLNGGGEFIIPMTAGLISAMQPVAQLDTSTGQGPLQVFTDRGAFSINAPVSRANWQNVDYPISSISMIDNGATSWSAAIPVNGDIWFRSNDGIRSFAVARRNIGQWANTPLSKEVEQFLVKDPDWLLADSSMALFDSRLLTTIGAYHDQDHGTTWRGLAVLDFSPLTTLAGSGQPAWEGIWTGLNIHSVFSGNFNGTTRCFTLARAADGDLELWELSQDDPFDLADVRKRIVSIMDTKSYNFESGGWKLLNLQTADFWLDDMLGTVTWDVDYRPDTEPTYQDWHDGEFCATFETCLTEQQCSAIDTLKAQYRGRTQLPQPGDACDTVTNKPYRHGYEFQARMTIEGHARLKRFRLFVDKLPESVHGDCPGSTASCVGVDSCDTDLLSYNIETANDA